MEKLLVVMAVAVLFPTVGAAQPATRKALEIGVGGRVAAPLPFGDVDADEVVFGGGRRPLFRSSSRLRAAPGAELRIAIRLTPKLQAEGSVGFARTTLLTSITADAEASNIEITEPLTQYALQIGLLRQIAAWGRGRTAPFVAAGAGFVRQLHDGHTVVDTGPVYYAGGGLDFRFNSRGSKITGIRVDVRETFLTADVTLDNEIHPMTVVGAALFFRF